MYMFSKSSVLEMPKIFYSCQIIYTFVEMVYSCNVLILRISNIITYPIRIKQDYVQTEGKDETTLITSSENERLW